MTSDDTLRPGQRRAVTALLSARTNAEAAEAGGCSERTLRRWRVDPAFVQALKVEARAASRQATASLLSAQTRAVRVLVGLMDNRRTDPVTRCRAAGLLLQHGQHAAADDLDARLNEMDGGSKHGTRTTDRRSCGPRERAGARTGRTARR